MKDNIAKEFYQLTEWLKTKDGTEDVLNEFFDRELGNILDYVEGYCDEEHFWESYVTMRIEEMMFKYGDMEVCGFMPDQEKLKAILNGD